MSLQLKRFFFTLLTFFTPSLFSQTICLRESLYRAHQGDYHVISLNKTVNLIHIYDNDHHKVTIEEISLPIKRDLKQMNWKNWIVQGAPGHNSWAMYQIDLQTGKMVGYYSFTKQGWFEIADSDNFLGKLLQMQLQLVSSNERRKKGVPLISGSAEERIWQPPLVFEGQTIRGVRFDCWRGRWPRDSSDLSEKIVELYTPQEGQGFSSYFPYWLQVSATIGKARVRIIDSGVNLVSSQPNVFSLRNIERSS